MPKSPPTISTKKRGAEMALDTAVKVTDMAIVMATFFGPVFAVWSQGALERRRARKNEQQRLFNVLMATERLGCRPRVLKP
jgi:hypothetical protein